MKRTWIFGAAIAALLGLNIVQGAVIFGLYAKSQIAAHETAPISLTDNKISALPAASQAVVKVSLSHAKPDLRARLTEVRKARHELVRYISSPHYQRAEAERRFEVLRAKSEQAQMVAQGMLLDAADNLPPDQRGQVVSEINVEGGE